MKNFFESWNRFLKEGTFEQAETGTPFSFVAYHWTTPKQAKKFVRLWKKRALKTTGNYDGVFVSDDKDSWASPWVEEEQMLIAMDVEIEAPLVNKEDAHGLEARIARGEVEKAKSNGYDALISVPVGKVSARQALLLDPNNQIKSVKLI